MRLPMKLALTLSLLLTLVSTASGQTSIELAEARQPRLVAVDDHLCVVHATKQGIMFKAFSASGEPMAEAIVAEFDRFPSGMRRGPRVASSGDAIVVTAIVDKPARLMAWRSTDFGKTWKMTAEAIGGEPDAVREGLHDMAAGPDGKMAVVWLDMRSVNENGTELWIAESDDAGLTWNAPRSLYKNVGGSICECCHPTVRYNNDGVPVVLFRNSVAGNRDMYLVDSTGRAQKLGDGTWPLEGCPMDGGDFAVSQSGSYGIVTTWRRGSTVYVARPGEPEQAIGEGSQPSVALMSDGTPIVFYTANDGLAVHVPDHKTSKVFDGAAGYPSVACFGEFIAVAAEGKGQSRILIFNGPAEVVAAD